jgi:hypothetical protein
MKSLMLAAISLLLIMYVAGAIDYNNLQNYAGMYNNKIQNASPLIKDILGSETVDFTIMLDNGSGIKWGMKMENAMIVNSAYGVLENPTIDVYATEDAIYKLLSAKDPVAYYKEAEEAGQMRIECKTLTAQIKLTAALSAGGAIKPFLNSLRDGRPHSS